MIRSELTQWIHETISILKRLKENREENRDELIEDVNDFLLKREKWLEQISPPFTKEEESLKEQLFNLETSFQKHLNRIQKQIQLNIQSNQQKINSSNAYLDPYSDVFKDGAFYDKKK